MEVLHGDIRITLNDQDAIRGVERIRTTVKRNMKAIAREKAEVSITGNLKDLRRNLKEAKALIEKHNAEIERLEAKRDTLSGAKKGAVTKQIKAEQARLAALEAQVVPMREQEKLISRHLDSMKRTNKEASLGVKQAKERERAEADLGRVLKENERTMQRQAREQEKQKMATISQRAEVAKLQQQYDKAYQSFQRSQRQPGRFRRAISPDVKQRVEIQQARALGEMEILRAKLQAMGHDPIEIDTHINEKGNLLAFLGNLGDIGTRIGPFSGTLAQFAKAALFLGPIIIGLVGSIGALAGAIGTGLTGGLGLGAAAISGFALSLGGVGLLMPALLRDFKNLNTLQSAYHKQVLKTGANSDKAKAKLEEFNHALGEVSPTTREAFNQLGKLQNRWRGMSHAARPDFMDALGESIRTVNADFGIFRKRTLEAFHAVSVGWQNWMKGLRSAEGQRVLDQIMGNTNRALPPLLSGLGRLGAALGKVVASFSRHLPALFRDFDAWAGRINGAASNTNTLNQGVSRLVGSFKQVWSVVTALSRVFAEFALTAMGPGGRMLDDMASGLNDIADAIAADRAGDNKLGKFLSESVDTTQKLYRALQPLLKLFTEFATLMRPASDALLDLVTVLGKLTSAAAGTGVGHAVLQAWASLWLFKRSSAVAVTTLAAAFNGLATAMKAAGAVKLAGVLARGGAALGATRAAGGAGGAAGAGAAGAAGGGAISGLLTKVGGAGVGMMAAGAMRGGIIGALTKSITGGLGGALLSGILRTAIWGNIGVGIVKGIITGFKKGVSTGAMEALHSITLGLTPKPKDFAKQDAIITQDIDRMVAVANQAAQARKRGIHLEVDIKHDKFDRAVQDVLNNTDRIRRGVATSLADAASEAEMSMTLIARSMNIHSRQGKEAVADAYRAIAAAIKRGIGRGVIDTEKGAAAIHRYLLKALAALGIEGRANQEGYLATQEFRREHPGSTGTGRNAGARGFYIGNPNGRGMDNIPLMVASGEAVINRHQQKYVNAGLQAIGINGLPDLFDQVQTPHSMNRGGIAASTGYPRPLAHSGASPRENEFGAATGRKPGAIPRYITRTSGMWGAAVQGGLDKYRAAAQSVQNSAWRRASGSMLGGAKGTAIKGGGALARALGLMITSTTGGKHATNSWHPKGRAIDVSGAPGNMADFFKAAARKWGSNILELFYDPMGYYIKNGHRVQGAIGGHSDHVHLAMARGGFAGAARGIGPFNPAKPGFSINTKRPDKGQLNNLVRALSVASGLGANDTAQMALIEALIAESGVRNLKGGDSSSVGILQLLDSWLGGSTSTKGGRRDIEKVVKMFLTSGFTGKGGAIKLSKRKGITPDQVATMVQGNRDGASTYRRFAGEAGNILRVWQKGGGITAGSTGPQAQPKRHGATLDLANLLALDEANLGRADRTRKRGDDIWATGVLTGRLGQQNTESRKRIDVIDKKLKGKLTKDDRASLLSERAGLVSSVEANKSRVSDLKKDASDKLFELKRGPGRTREDVDYKTALADSTEALDDDMAAAQAEADYYSEREKWAIAHHDKAAATEARNSFNAAQSKIKGINDQIAANAKQANIDRLGAVESLASLTPQTEDDMAAAQMAADYWQSQLDIAMATGDNPGISEAAGALKSARDTMKAIADQMAMLPLETNSALASLTTDLGDDVSAAQGFVDFWTNLYNAATGAEKVSAAQNLAGAQSTLKDAVRNAQLLPLERDAAFAALTETLDDDKQTTIALRDYWKSQLDNASAVGDIQGQIEAAGNLKSLNDEIKQAEQTVANQMILLSEARRDLYKAFANNFISQLPAGTSVPSNSTTYAGKTYNVTNYFQQPPPDPHTWSVGVAWELQASV